MAVTKKASVRRLHVSDPYNLYSQYGAGFGLNPTVATFTPEFDKLTNNPNPVYQPQGGQSTVAIRQRAPKPIGAASRIYFLSSSCSLFSMQKFSTIATIAQSSESDILR